MAKASSLCPLFGKNSISQSSVSTFDFNAPVIVDGVLGHKVVVTSKTSGSTATYSASEIVGGMIIDAITQNCTATTATAADIIAAIPGAQTGTSFFFILKNAASSSLTITLAAGTGVTIVGTATVGQNNTKLWLVRVTSSSTVTFYSIGTMVH